MSTIAGTLALLVCWIPVVGQALAAALLLVSTVSALVAAVANVILATAGEQPWTAAIVSIVGAALACVGLGALKGAFGGLKVAAGAWKTAGGAADLGGATLKNFTTSLKGFGSSLAGRFTVNIRPPKLPVPKYGDLGSKTSGTLVRPDGTAVSLISGWHPPASLMPKGTPGMDIVTKMHVEAHAAAIMRLDGLKTATLWLNRTPCAGITGCEHLLPRMVPQGSELLIHIVSNGSSANIVRTLLVKGVG